MSKMTALNLATKRDVVVIGCSAGGVDTLPKLLAPLPPDLPASVCIVQHLGATETSQLPAILARAAQLPVKWAEQGAPVEKGHIYVAPPNSHLLIVGEHLMLSGGPRENHSRPSIDKLFRSAAAECGSRTIGVLLTGMLDDGVAGLRAIQQAGGLTIVQDPEDADFPELPSRAVSAMTADRVAPVLGIASALAAWVGRDIDPIEVPKQIGVEARIDRIGVVDPATLGGLGPQSPVSCPDCHGPTWLIGDEHARRYRCYLGHVSSARDVLLHESLATEAALWSAVRALHERAMTLESLAADSDRVGRSQVAEIYAGRAREARSQATLAHKFLTDVVSGLKE
ncbi:MAG: chemotaxis protein CheB [Deltaproteobacteria bacterium]|nr:chemotaxis protein CheB [Deltaproteobacteria bacterium]